MVARSAPTLRFSVRHKEPATVAPSPSNDPRSSNKIPFASETTNPPSTRRHAIIPLPAQQKQPFKQTQLSFQSLTAADTAPSPSPSASPPATIPGHDRPFKKAKLDGRHHDQQPPAAPAKLPLRSRDSQGVLTPDNKNNNTRTTRSSRGTTNVNNSTNVAVVPPSAPSSATTSSAPRLLLPTSPASAPSAVTRSMRRSAALPTPVRVSEDVEKGVNDGVGAAVGSRQQLQPPQPPAPAAAGRERRSLRSNDGGSRSKSELAMYFQNYEQILSLEPVKHEFLSADTAVLLVNDLTQPIVLDPLPPNPSQLKPQTKQDQRKSTNGHNHAPETNSPLTDLYQAQIIDLPIHDLREAPSKDPLGDDVYFKAHRRIERQEKQLRNIERERAQHEKVQLDRLLDELQGHDWLRVMGISGITDTEKKLYEPKRAYFIKEVSALIDKFRVWKEEEKRRKIEREQSLAEEGDEDDEEDEEEEEEEEEVDNASADDNEENEADEYESKDQPHIKKEDTTHPRTNGEPSPPLTFQTYGEPPDINDVDAWAARQLHQEANLSASLTNHHLNHIPKPSTSTSTSSSHPSSPPPRPPAHDSDHAARSPSPQPPQQQQQQPKEPEPFTSFYTKRHMRDAAVGKIRRAGRTRSAFGQLLPEMSEREFCLPRDILTEEAIDACQRKKRRLRRERG
ncbi:hypothetical protein FQN55_006369 [Onygenales sp. PD_40]|nr:hypothetical protein FQN55_006369 [Onygenales sp. PD_40]KAK2761842.1 hypothetical protein FQN53_007660 [Emmonsiellopsis sp. PD_33]